MQGAGEDFVTSELQVAGVQAQRHQVAGKQGQAVRTYLLGGAPETSGQESAEHQVHSWSQGSLWEMNRHGIRKQQAHNRASIPAPSPTRWSRNVIGAARQGNPSFHRDSGGSPQPKVMGTHPFPLV